MTLDGTLRGEPVYGSQEEFVGPVDRPYADVVEAYLSRAALTDEIMLCADLGAGLHDRKRPGITPRWVLLHVIEETALHGGHADATRELLNGSTGV